MLMSNRKGTLFIISGPSGTGKGTVIRELLSNHPEDVFLSVSATTRNPREGEIEGIHYYFKSKSDFETMISEDGFLEWACFCENYYGTPKEIVNSKLKSGIDVILEIEIQGAMKLKDSGIDAKFIFILPPSFEELKRRLTDRQTESAEVIKKRLDTAKSELPYAEKYDYVVVNDSVENAIHNIDSIINAERCKVDKNKNIIEEVQR